MFKLLLPSPIHIFLKFLCMLIIPQLFKDTQDGNIFRKHNLLVKRGIYISLLPLVVLEILNYKITKELFLKFELKDIVMSLIQARASKWCTDKILYSCNEILPSEFTLSSAAQFQSASKNLSSKSTKALWGGGNLLLGLGFSLL